MDLPYRAEYAKSGRASCRGCKSIILKGDLRLAAMIQSPAFDGRVPHWYHFDCFFVKQRPTTEDDIAHFESLRWEDQEKIKKQISTLSSIVVPAKKGKKRNAGASLPSQSALIDYFIQYAKSGRSSCRGCEQTIMKDEIRVSKRDFQTDIGKRYGGQDMWHHLTCFAKLRSELGYFECGDSIPGFKTLSIEDQAQVKIELPAIKQETIPEKKIKLEDETDGKSQEKEMKEQNKIMYKYRDQLKELSKSELQKLFDKNNQEIPVGTDRVLNTFEHVKKECPAIHKDFVSTVNFNNDSLKGIEEFFCDVLSQIVSLGINLNLQKTGI